MSTLFLRGLSLNFSFLSPPSSDILCSADIYPKSPSSAVTVALRLRAPRFVVLPLRFLQQRCVEYSHVTGECASLQTIVTWRGNSLPRHGLTSHLTAQARLTTSLQPSGGAKVQADGPQALKSVCDSSPRGNPTQLTLYMQYPSQRPRLE